MAEQFKDDGLVVLAVNAWNEDLELLTEFAKKENLKQRILLDGGSTFKEAYGLSSVPAVLWIDREGRVVDTELDFNGPGTLEKKTRKLVGGA